MTDTHREIVAADPFGIHGRQGHDRLHRRLVLWPRRNEENRSFGVVDDAVRDAAEEHRLDARAAAAAEHDEFDAFVVGRVENGPPDVTAVR